MADAFAEAFGAKVAQLLCASQRVCFGMYPDGTELDDASAEDAVQPDGFRPIGWISCSFHILPARRLTVCVDQIAMPSVYAHQNAALKAIRALQRQLKATPFDTLALTKYQRGMVDPTNAFEFVLIQTILNEPWLQKLSQDPAVHIIGSDARVWPVVETETHA